MTTELRKINNPIPRMKIQCSHCKRIARAFFRGKPYCSRCNPKEINQPIKGRISIMEIKKQVKINGK